MKLLPKPERFETVCGLILSVLASLLTIVQISDNNFRTEMLKSINEKSQSYQWYQSKGIKQNLTEGQAHIIELMLHAKTIEHEDTTDMYNNVEALYKKVERYEKEKAEILRGSDAIGVENWTQEIDGQKGKVVGAKIWELKICYYDEKSKTMSIASLLLQIAIVMGGLTLIIQEKQLKNKFFYMMSIMGISGFLYALYGFLF